MKHFDLSPLAITRLARTLHGIRHSNRTQASEIMRSLGEGTLANQSAAKLVGVVQAQGQSVDFVTLRKSALLLSTSEQLAKLTTRADENLSESVLEKRVAGLRELAAVHQMQTKPPPGQPVVHVAAFLEQNNITGELVLNLAGQDLRSVPDLAGQIRAQQLHMPELRFDFTQAQLSGVNLSNMNLPGANFTGAILLQANLRHSNLQRANFGNANLLLADLRNTNLTNAHLFLTVLRSADLSHADMKNARLQGAIAQEAIFNDVDFRGAVLWWSKMQGAYLNSRTLFDERNVFRAVDVSGVDLTGITLPDAQGEFISPLYPYPPESRPTSTMVAFNVSEIFEKMREDSARHYNPYFNSAVSSDWKDQFLSTIKKEDLPELYDFFSNRYFPIESTPLENKNPNNHPSLRWTELIEFIEKNPSLHYLKDYFPEPMKHEEWSTVQLVAWANHPKQEFSMYAGLGMIPGIDSFDFSGLNKYEQESLASYFKDSKTGPWLWDPKANITLIGYDKNGKIIPNEYTHFYDNRDIKLGRWQDIYGSNGVKPRYEKPLNPSNRRIP